MENHPLITAIKLRNTAVATNAHPKFVLRLSEIVKQRGKKAMEEGKPVGDPQLDHLIKEAHGVKHEQNW